MQSDFARFTPYLTNKYLMNLKYNTRIRLGEPFEDIASVLNQIEIETIQNEKFITISEHNIYKFKSNEEIKLYVDIKNVPEVTVKVFEFQTENYYKSKLTQVDNNFSLDGLIATDEEVFKFDLKPQVVAEKLFTFEKISYPGIFFIEFVGNGVSSRAVIRKGKLTLRSKLTVVGHAFQIFNDDFTLCKGENTGIWDGNQMHRVDEKGEILIPFTTDQNRSIKAVLIHNNQSELCDIVISSQKQNLQANFIYNSLSFVENKLAKVLVQPILKVFTQKVPSQIIENYILEVIQVNRSNIPQKTVFENLKLSENQDLEIQFQVQSQLQFVQFNLIAKFKNLQDKSPMNLTVNHQVTLQKATQTNQFCNLFLRNSSDQGYEIYLLGKTGEPKSDVEIRLTYQILGISKTVSATLQTDKEGKVKLGKLDGIGNITVGTSGHSVLFAPEQSFTINVQNSINYPQNMFIIEGEKIRLPLGNNEEKYIFFKQFVGVQTLENCKSLVDIEDSFLTISGLKKGQYLLRLINSNVSITIYVFRGEIWNGCSLKTEDALLEFNNRPSILFVKSFSQLEDSEKEAHYKLSVESSLPQGTRVHLFAYNFVLNNKFNSSGLPENTLQEFPIRLQKSSYFNNKQLGDEHRYVLDRQKLEKFVGNGLNKPQLLLKRNFIKETGTKDEKVNSEQDYTMKRSKQAYGDRMECKSKNEVKNEEHLEQVQINQVLSTNSGLCHELTNLRLNDQGEVEFSLPKGKFSNITYFLVNDEQTIVDKLSLKHVELQFIKGTHQKKQKEVQYQGQVQLTKGIQENEEFIIEDINSSQYNGIDSLKKLYEILKILQGLTSNQYNNNQWEFLTNWNLFDLSKKFRQYDIYASHELNIFLFFKDPSFFNNFIKPFIQSKIKKTFIDYFLIGNDEILCQASEAASIEQLNAFEMVLVIQYFKTKKNEKQARSILDFLQLKAKQTDKQRNALFKRYFETVINQKKEEEKKFKPAPSIPRQPRMEMQQVLMDCCVPAPPPLLACQPQMASHSIQNRSMKLCSLECQPIETENAMMKPQEELSYIQKVAEKQVVQFKGLEKAKEYEERQYYEQNSSKITAALIPITRFWCELGEHILIEGQINSKKRFLSSEFMFSNSNDTELVFILAVIGLPFQSSGQEFQRIENTQSFSMKCLSPTLVFYKKLSNMDLKISPNIIVGQSYFDEKDKYQVDPDFEDITTLKQVKEFLIDVVYTCQITLTNCSESPKRLEVSAEIPEGAISVNSDQAVQLIRMDINPLQTETYSFQFYFPYLGTYSVKKTCVCENGKVVGVLKDEYIFEVKPERHNLDDESLNDILYKGDLEKLYLFLQTKNLLDSRIFSFNSIYFLLKGKDVWTKILMILKERRIYDQTVWSFCIFHGDCEVFKEFLLHKSQKDQLAKAFTYFKCSFLSINTFQILEYFPLATQRVHSLHTDKCNILNNQFRDQYKSFLQYLCEKPESEVEDWLTLVYYLLLQDRIGLAVKVYTKDIDKFRSQLSQHQLQADYLEAYLSIYIDNSFKNARKICENYLNYPVLSWRTLFYQIINLITEVDSELEPSAVEKRTELEEELKRQQNNATQASNEVILTLEQKENGFLISYENVSQLTVRFYEVDIEVLFSKSPFLDTNTADHFSYLKPNYSEQLTLISSKQLQTEYYIIPKAFENKSIFVQVYHENVSKFGFYHKSNLKVSIFSNFGQLKVQNIDEKPQPKVYVKVFARTNSGEINFFKDGYTDLAGKFDYVYLNSPKLDSIKEFAILVIDDSKDWIVNTVQKPQVLASYKDMFVLQSEKQNQKAAEKYEQQLKAYNSFKK